MRSKRTREPLTRPFRASTVNPYRSCRDSRHAAAAIDEQRAAERVGFTPASGAGLRPEEAVAEISEPGQDVLVLVEAAVESGRVHLGLGVGLLQEGDAFRGGDDAEQPDVPSAQLAQPLDRHRRGAAGGEHRIQQIDDRVLKVFGHTLVVAARDRRLLVALEAEVADLRARNELEESIEHAKAGAQHWYRHHSSRQTP